MKKGKLIVGDTVVVNDLPDATHYEVLEVSGFMARIREAGTEYKAHWQDISIMKYPTKTQRLVRS